jgi:hypothetical protein
MACGSPLTGSGYEDNYFNAWRSARQPTSDARAEGAEPKPADRKERARDDDLTPPLPGPSPVKGKTVIACFGGGSLSSVGPDGGHEARSR